MEDGVSMRLLAGGTPALQETAVLQGTAFLPRGMVGEMAVQRGGVTAETAVLHETPVLQWTAVLQGTAFLPRGMAGEMAVPWGEVTAETAVLHETAVLPKGNFFSLFHHFIPNDKLWVLTGYRFGFFDAEYP